MSNKSMQFLFGDRELLLLASDLLTAPVDVIVNPTDTALLHQHELASRLLLEAGEEMAQQSRQLIRQYGEIEAGMAVYTSAGNLSYEALIHTVAPGVGDADIQGVLQQSISRCLMLCETNAWGSIAFPALGVNENDLPVALCAQAFFRAITSFWDARFECAVEKIILCLEERQFRSFFDAFREDAIEPESASVSSVAQEPESENVGYVDLQQEDLDNLDDEEIAGWFK
jgi:O-acetyl-ADP-ribose deacetylase (regulator of RNase III)